MLAEILRTSDVTAGRAIGLTDKAIKNILEAKQTRIVNLGTLVITTKSRGERRIEAWRGISGPDGDWMDKGGSRMTDRDPLGDLDMLPQEMWAKLHQAGLTDINGKPLNGGKLLFNVDPGTLNHEEKIAVFAAAGDAMLRSGRGGHNRSVPAGDMGTNHPEYMDAYAHRIKQSGDPYWQASITGKSLGMGGLAFRPHATGYGVYLAADYQRKALELDGPARLTISGAGNVGGYVGYYASMDPNFVIRGYSDSSGTLYVVNDSPAVGIVVDKDVLAIMDNPNFKHDEKYARFKGNKLAALSDLLAQTQPELELKMHKNPEYIMQVPADIFVPASVGGLIKADTKLSPEIRAVVEGGNGSFGPGGFDSMALRDIAVIPGTIANTGGVATSMDEYRAGITGKTLSFDEAKDLATMAADQRLERMSRMAELLGVSNVDAAEVLGMAGMARQLGHDVSADIAVILDNRGSYDRVA